MKTVKPVEPIRPVRGIRGITLRRVPSFRQLRMWLVFARQKAKDGPRWPQASGQSGLAGPEVPADRESEAEREAADHGHIDKLA
jgi:hypothetical protein